MYDWYGDWRDSQIACPKCGWKGMLKEEALEEYDQLADFSCPTCQQILAIINYPTRADIERNWDKLPAQEKALYSGAFKKQDEFANTRLDSPNQLPEIDADSIVLVWDSEEKPDNEGAHATQYVVIKHDGKPIWQELAFYECVGRFDQVVTILQQKYGSRLKDLVPSEASKTYLGGDDLSAWEKLAKIRARMAPAEVDTATQREALVRAGDRNALNAIRFEREYEAHHLQDANKLPKLRGRSFYLFWDIAEDPPRVEAQSDGNEVRFEWSDASGDGFLYATISSRRTMVWREAASDASWWGKDGKLRSAFVERYIEISQILKHRYGDRLVGLIPTERSAAYVQGMAWDQLHEAYDELFGKPSDVAAP